MIILLSLRSLEDESVDLVYLDPPFCSKRTYAGSSDSISEGAVFKDTWSPADIGPDWMSHISNVAPSLLPVFHSARDAAR